MQTAAKSRNYSGPALAFIFLLAGLTFFGRHLESQNRPSSLPDLRWLSADADAVTFLTQRPIEPINYDPSKEWDPELELGRIAFRSPYLFAGFAAREGLTCQTCHINGHPNTNFFVEAHSSEPGTFDTTSAVFSKVLGDGVFNPLPIPSLLGIADTAPYGHDGREATLEGFVQSVIVEEFSGDPPTQRLMEALLHYISGFQPQSMAHQPVSAKQDLQDFNRGLTLLTGLLEQQTGDEADFVIRSLRFHLAGVAARYPFAEQQSIYDLLVGWSRDLQTIATHVEKAKWRNALRRTQWLQKTARKFENDEQFDGTHSLYDPATLGKWLADESR